MSKDIIEDKVEDSRFSGILGDDYDDTFKLICPHLEKLEASVGDSLVELYKKSPDRKVNVLDLGAGDGLTTIAILDSDRPYNLINKLIALDNEPNMLGQLTSNVSAKYPLAPLELIQEDALTYLKECESESFDFIGSCFVLHNFLDNYRQEVLAEIFRVLKPKGVFSNADKFAQEQPKHAQTLKQQIQLVIDSYLDANRPDLMREWILHYLDDEIPGRIWFEHEARQQLEHNGFRVIKTFRHGMEATLEAWKI